MIKFQATSLIHSISPVLQVTERFQKRELVLNDSWQKDGEVHHNFILIEFSGDKMAMLDNFAPGQRVTVECVVNGREYNGRIYNTIKGLKIEHYQQQQPGQYGQQPPYPQGGGYAPMPGYHSQPAGGYATQPQYSSAPADAFPPQGQRQPSGPGVNQLPFGHK